MNLAFALLLGLIAAIPVFPLIAAPFVYGLIGTVVAAGFCAIALRMRPGEAKYLWVLFWPAAVMLAPPAAYVAVQCLKAPFSVLQHPIWETSEAALGQSITHSISVDPGKTVLALAYYMVTAGAVFVSAGLTIDRARAEWVLAALASISAVMATVLLVEHSGALAFLEDRSGALRTAAAGVSGLGVIITTAAAIRAFERYETRRSKLEMTFRSFAKAFSLSLGALFLNGFALFYAGAGGALFASMCGFAAIITVLIIRRFGLGPLVSTVVVASEIALAIALLVTILGNGGELRAVASSYPPELADMIRRIQLDTGLGGSGAGTFSALVPIYQFAGASFPESATTTDAVLTIELGRPAVVGILLIACVAIGMLFRGALERGRDSFYPAAAGAAVLLVSLEAFADSALTAPSVNTLAAITLGLGIAQRKSRPRA